MANSATSFRLSEVVSFVASLLDGSSVEEVISIKAAALEMPSSRRCESAFWFLRLSPNPRQRCDFALLRLPDCSAGTPSFCHLPLFDPWWFAPSIPLRALALFA